VFDIFLSAMSRSHHVTKKMLRQERMQLADLPPEAQAADMTALEEGDIRKSIAKVNTAWKRQAERDSLNPGLRMQLSDSGIEVV
jgi:hypothetical protein